MTEVAKKITMENASFQAIVDRVRNQGRTDEFGTYHLGHWAYRIEDGGMTDVIINTDIGIAYYRSWDNRIEGKHLMAYA